MADVCDIAGDLIDRELASQVAVRKPTLKPKGYCLWCQEPTQGFYCSEECRTDHTKYMLRNQ